MKIFVGRTGPINIYFVKIFMLKINKNEQNGFHVFGKTMNNDDP